MAPARHVVFGCNGPVGTNLIERLVARGDVEVIGVCRSGRADLPAAVRVVAADASDRTAAAEAAAGADVIYLVIGIDYGQWFRLWPKVVDGLIHAAERAGARLIFGDNLSCYGPTEEPLVETLPLTTFGRKDARVVSLVVPPGLIRQPGRFARKGSSTPAHRRLIFEVLGRCPPESRRAF